jgi:hypothetical protein
MKMDVGVRHFSKLDGWTGRVIQVDAATGDEAAALGMAEALAAGLQKVAVISVTASAVTVEEIRSVEPAKVTAPKVIPPKDVSDKPKQTKVRAANPVLAALDEEKAAADAQPEPQPNAELEGADPELDAGGEVPVTTNATVGIVGVQIGAGVGLGDTSAT